MDHILLYYQKKRPNNSKEALRLELIDYLKEESQKQHFPSRRELQQKFHFNLHDLFNGIYDLYACAGMTYKLAPNQDEKINKAAMLLKVITENIDRFDLTLVKYRAPTERGIDIIAFSKTSFIGIELKAYNGAEQVKLKDLTQVRKAITKEKLSKAIIITTTNRIHPEYKQFTNITIVCYNKLKELLPECTNTLEYIHETSVNKSNPNKEAKRQNILDYVSKQNKLFNKKPTYNNILKDLHLDLYSYFNSLFDIYKTLEILPPTRKMKVARAKKPDKNLIALWKKHFKKYILEEVKKGHHPSGNEVGKKFGISHIWNIVKISELYNELGLIPYRERAKRKPTSLSKV